MAGGLLISAAGYVAVLLGAHEASAGALALAFVLLSLGIGAAETISNDVIISSGYRIGPFEVESALVAHEAVAEAAVVAAPDEERGSVVRAVVVLRDGFSASDDLATVLQRHVKEVTAPYKYPRVVDFADSLPKTTSGKVRRALLREQ